MGGSKRKRANNSDQSPNKHRRLSLSLKERRKTRISKENSVMPLENIITTPEKTVTPPVCEETWPKLAYSPIHDDKVSRFATITSPELEQCKKKATCANTGRARHWAFNVFAEWIHGVYEFTESDLWCDDGEKVSRMLSKFVAEARQKKGCPYTPKTLLQLLINLQSVAYEKNAQACHFMDQKNVVFAPLHNVLENPKKLLTQGIGAEKKQARVIEVSEENALWDKNIMGCHSPTALLNAIFFYCGLFCCLRGGQEHRSLKYSQFLIKNVNDPSNPEQTTTCLVYNEHGSKNHQGGMRQLHLENKSVTHYEDKSLGERCFVQLFRLYTSKLPEKAIEKDLFYCRPKPNCDGDVWYYPIAIGHNVLAKKLKDMFNAAQLNVDEIHNHSLRATSISRMYERGVPEKIIMDRSGHHSVGGVHSYERITELQKKEVCETLTDKKLGVLNDIVNNVPQKPHDDEAGKFHFKDVHGCTFNFTINK